MPLKIICSNCGEVLISKYLRKGDSIFCQKCDKDTFIDDRAVQISDEEADAILLEEKKTEELPGENQRFEYKFVEVEIDHGFFSNNLPGDYTKIIDDHAKEGWRFVQIFPIEFSGYHPSSFQIVFERELT